MNNKRLITLWCLLAVFAVATVRAQVVRLTVTAFQGRAEYIASGHKHALRKGIQLTEDSQLYIPYNGSVTLIDEKSNKEYTLKSLGWATVEDKLKDNKSTVLTRSKDYVKSVVAQFRGGGSNTMQPQYYSDPCTVTREYYDASAKLEEVPNQKKEAKNFRADFDAFKKQARKEYDDFRKKAFKEYREFVRQAWKEFGVEKPIEQPEEQEVEPMIVPDADAETASWFSKIFRKKNKDKDKAQAEQKKPVEQKRDRTGKGEAISYSNVLAAAPAKPQPQPLSEVKEVPEDANTYKSFKIFGTEFTVRIGDDCRFQLKGTSSNDVADAMQIFEQPQFDNLLYDCLKMREKYSMSDWAYYQMLLALTDMFYGQDSNEGALVLGFLYSQSGYKMRLACFDNGLDVLIASEHMIYNTAYVNIDGINYYIFTGGDRQMMNICQAKFPKEGPMSLRITASQNLAMTPAPERTITSKKNSDFSFTVSSNKNYMDFFDTYPPSCINDNFMTRWAMYANTPIEKGIKNQLYPQMKAKLNGLSESDAVQQLLWWVQTGFEYEYDEVVWGHDRAFFGEETIFYPYCDCEDRSILLSHLVRDLLGLKVILVYYPGHLAMAVNFKEDVPGDYIMHNGMKFVVCDPTYIGANVGESMPSMKGLNTTVILLDS